MVALYPILSLLVVFAVSLLVVRVGSVGLRMTGLSPDVSSFQAASAFSGAGFTTSEAERAVATPERRAIVKALIRLGSVGLVSVIASLVLSFTNSPGAANLRSLAYIIGGVLALVLLARSRWLNRLVTPLIERALSLTTGLEVRDYTRMLGLQRDYGVARVDVAEESWLANETPASVELGEEGVLLLGIEREDDYVGAPDGDTEVLPGDTVVLYGREDRIGELAGRAAGDEAAHEDAVAEHDGVLAAQERRLAGDGGAEES